MPINISGTDAEECDVVLDAPMGADVKISDTRAKKVGTVYKIRFNHDEIEKTIRSQLIESTPPELIEKFIESLESLDHKDLKSIELETYRTGLDRYLNNNTTSAIGLASSLYTLISPLF
ncbi:hypothetical protein [Acinetobacter guillouiae]|uniref:hypothetical protein n=1 Tax=Acinetobacter guillouiae TaxID=106649 RepID=UPI003C6F1891